MLTVSGLKAGYDEFPVLFGVDLKVGSGEIITLLGRNGMGKTTTLRVISGIIKPKEGKVCLDGLVISGWRSYRIAKAGIGFVPEDRQVFPSLNVVENLIATARPGYWTLHKVFSLFPLLADRQTIQGGLLSGGEQQMLVIGRALMTNPRLLILDEATEGLAPMVRSEIWSCLGKLKDMGMAVLVVDKYASASVELVDRHYIMEKGVISWSGSSAELSSSVMLRGQLLSV
tara:strand:- start:1578 stop:2264 length:687 start_codon:yes stop_codon:yes gene_type:complete